MLGIWNRNTRRNSKHVNQIVEYKYSTAHTLDRRVLGLAHAPNVTSGHLVLKDRLAGRISDLDRARGGQLEGLVVRAVPVRACVCV